jgi:hypothetical protein
MAKRKQEKIDFKEMLKNAKIPILTLDERWHELFPEYEKTAQIKNLEHNLNDLIKLQGKIVNDIKDLKKLKVNLMNQIVANMGETDGKEEKLKIKKQEKSQQLIKDINVKLEDADDELIDLPHKIKQANEELLVESMKVCYERLKQNKVEIQNSGIWIMQVREELKERIMLKQDMEMKNAEIYSYMHDMIGPHIIDLFDEKNKE